MRCSSNVVWVVSSLASSAEGPGFNLQSRTASYQRLVPVVPLFGTRHFKGKYWLFLKNKDRVKHVMDKIWDRNPSKSEVIGRCDGDEKNEWSRRTDKSRTLKKPSIYNVSIEIRGKHVKYMMFRKFAVVFRVCCGDVLKQCLRKQT